MTRDLRGRPLPVDLRDGAAASARDILRATFDGLVAKGRVQAIEAESTLARIEAVGTLQSAATASLAVEAIVDNLDARRSRFAQLEAVLCADAVLAINTSSTRTTAANATA